MQKDYSCLCFFPEKMPAVTDIFHENTLREILHASQNPSEQEIERILEKEKDKGISLEEAALLLHVQDEALWKKIFHLAREIKESIYGERIVFFAPSIFQVIASMIVIIVDFMPETWLLERNLRCKRWKNKHEFLSIWDTSAFSLNLESIR